MQDEEEYSDSDDSGPSRRAKKKPKRSGVGDFILEEAEVDDEVEDDEEYEEGFDNYVGQDIGEDGPTAREIESGLRRHSIWE